MYKKLLENKNKLDKDKCIQIYEKIFLIIDVYSSGLLYKDDYIVHYFHIKDIEVNSPLFYAYKFLDNFIKELNYDSNFYYPLLSIAGGFYEYNYKKNHGNEYISTYGFNMLSLDTIKDHLKNMIPNIILWSKYIKNNYNAYTNPLNGNVILNINKFVDISIDKNELDESNSKHYAFIITKILIHELFGNKLSYLSKSGKNNDSIISFRNELGELKLIDINDNEDIFKDINEISNGKNPDCFKGDSGYFIEYFLGKINNEYTIVVIDSMEKLTNLSKLLNPILWHKDISTFKEYLKLMYIYSDLFHGKNIDNNLTIFKQIEVMKGKIDQEDKKIQEKNSSKNTEIKIEQRIDQIFIDIWKKRRNNKMNKGKAILQ